MKIIDKRILQINITAILENIEIESISSQKLKDIFELNDDERKNTVFFEVPGIRSFFIQNRAIEVIFESNRIRFNDKTGKEAEESNLIYYLQKVFVKLFEVDKIIAYGFNYDVLISYEEKINFENLFSDNVLKILNGEKLLEAGFRIAFKKNERRLDFQLVPILGNLKQVIATLNVHFDIPKIENYDLIKEQFLNGYSEMQEIISRLEV